MEQSKKESDKIEKSILDFIGSDTKKRTPAEVTKYVKSNFQIPLRQIKNHIKNLITSGGLEYSNDFGRSFLELSYSKPVKVSERLFLTPSHIKNTKSEKEVFVIIEKGISFGRGTHPTTRLCLQAIDYILKDRVLIEKPTNALDIGTGSGVLIIAGVLLGIESAHACEIDNISLNEAKNNIFKNNLDEKISLSKAFDINEKYNFIFANLRYPSLIDLYESFLQVSQGGSFLFLSGIKVEERLKIENKFLGMYFEKIWEKDESGWICFVFKRKS